MIMFGCYTLDFKTSQVNSKWIDRTNTDPLVGKSKRFKILKFNKPHLHNWFYAIQCNFHTTDIEFELLKLFSKVILNIKNEVILTLSWSLLEHKLPLKKHIWLKINSYPTPNIVLKLELIPILCPRTHEFVIKHQTKCKDCKKLFWRR